MIWFLLACGGADTDWHDQLEVGLGVSEFSFRVQRTLSMSCVDEQGASHLYVHAFSRRDNRDCRSDAVENDAGDSIAASFEPTCGGIEAALNQEVFVGENIFCGGGRMPNDREHQAVFWFSEWDEEWPIDSLYAGGSYTTCVGAEPATGDPARNTSIDAASFTPDPYSDELLVGGNLHGVLNVDHCGSL